MALYEYYTDNNTWENFYGAYHRGQSFTIGTVGPNEAFTLTSIIVKGFREGSPGTLTIKVYAVDGDGLPTGDILSQGTAALNSITTETTGEEVEVTMSAMSCQPSTKYAFCMSISGLDTSNDFNWLADSTSPSYTGGCFIQSSDSGANWTNSPGNDGYFKISGTAAPSATTNNLKFYRRTRFTGGISGV